MKQNSCSLRIDNPCEQDWTAMVENDVGKFCSHCSKKVVDFTNLSDTQIVKHASGKVCGRLTNHQLNRQLLQSKQQIRNLLFPKILAGLLLVAATEKSFAVRNVSQIVIVSATENKKPTVTKTNNNLTETSATDSLKYVVQGKVIDLQTNDALPSALIRIKNAKINVSTNAQGEFKLTIPDILLTENIVLQISYLGFETMEITITKKDLPLTKTLTLTPAKIVMGEVVITRN